MKFTYILAISFLAYSPWNHAEVLTDSKPVMASARHANSEHSLPDDHPIKSELDAIFNASRVLSSASSYKKAGFYPTRERRKGLIVTSHSLLSGYLVKMYLETAPVDEMELFMKRIRGAISIQKELDNFGYNSIMKVPKKWIYNVPSGHSSDAGKYPKKYILVVEDMDIYSDDENRRLYKKIITEQHLDALFNILTTCLLSDSTWLPNIPFSYDGRIAFIDTEFAGTSLTIWSRLSRMSKNLSSEMRLYWEKLLLNNPRPKGISSSIENSTGSVDEAFDVPTYEDESQEVEAGV